MNKSEKIAELGKALVKAQSEIRGAIKDSNNPFFKSKYADLESCWEAIRDPLTRNGLSVVQTFDVVDGHSVLETTLIHVSGEWMSGRLILSPVKQDPQSVGSAITYARRYALAAIVGLIQIDDDGEAAHGRLSEAHTVKNVTESQSVAKKSALVGPGNCPECGRSMLKSKYQNGPEYYCPNYKNHRGSAA